MSGEALVLLGIHLVLLSALARDEFRTVNMWADIFEAHCLPTWLQWSTMGDKVSWTHHALIAAAVSLYGGLLSTLTPESFVTGAVIAAWFAFCAYAAREAISAYGSYKRGRTYVWTHPSPSRVGWAVDGILDVVGPLLVALFWTLL